MSGSQTTLFGGGNRWITNPKHLSLISSPQTILGLKTSVSTVALSNAAGFYTNGAYQGATQSISVADTYVTLASLSGAGFLCNVVSPTHTASFIPTIRITVDSVVYTIAPTAGQTAGNRLILGPVTHYLTIAAATDAAQAKDSIGVNSANDGGFAAARVGGVTIAGGFNALTTVDDVLAMGWQALRFETSCLVEVKCNLLSGTAQDKAALATYRMDL